MSRIIARVGGSGNWKRGKGEADFLKSCAKCDGEVKIFKITPQKEGVDFFLEVSFFVAGSFCCDISDEGIAEWRIKNEILPSVFSSWKIRE